MKKLLLLLPLLFIGCSQKEIVRVDTLYVAIPPLNDSSNAHNHNNIWYAERVVEHDTLWQVKLNTETKVVYIKTKPDTIEVLTTDTLYQTKEVIKNVQSFSLILLLAVMGLIALAIIIWRVKK